MLPNYDQKNPKLMPSIVCFTDLLGFSNVTMNYEGNIEEGNKLLNKLHSILNDQIHEMKSNNISNYHLKTFTDNIIFAYPLLEDGEYQSGGIFLAFSRYQLAMVMNNFFVRGGISIGEYYGGNDFAYGPALIKAYDLESKIALNPRIILSENTEELVNFHLSYYGEGQSPQSQFLLRDCDDIIFINYLNILIDDVNEDYDIEKYMYQLKKHKEIVLQNLREHEDHKGSNQDENSKKVYKKYIWVAQYHNYFCENFVRKEHNENLQIENIPKRKFSMI